MKRQVRLYIGGQEADLGDGDLILFNYTLEDLSNPTIVKNSYTQQVTLKGTPTNNNIFGHIWRLDRDQQFGGSTGPDFDPSRKTGFQLFDATGNLLESGYVKLDNILRHGVDIQYAVTLYGGLGSFLYGLSFDSDGNPRTLAGLDYLGTEDPEHELDFTIDAATVTAAWAHLLSDPVGISSIWDVVNFAPCYNGYPDNFDPSKGLVDPTAIGLPATHPDDASYGTVNGWALLNMTKSMTEWETKDLRSYLQRPVVSVRAVLAALANQANNGGYTFDASVLDGSDYDKMWVTLPMLPTLEAYKNIQQTINLTVDGTPGTGTFSVPISIGTSLQVGSKVDVSLNLSVAATVSGATATPLYFRRTEYTGGIETTERYNYSGFFAQLVAYDADDRILAGSKVLCIGASEDDGQFAKDGKTRADTCGFTPQIATEYQFVEAVMAGAGGSYTLSQDLNLTVSCYNAEKYKVFITPYHYRKTIHFGATYRKTWHSHALGSSAMTVYSSTTDYSYTSVVLSSGSAGSTASYKTPDSVRSGASISKAMLLQTDYSPADFLLGISKSLGLYLHYDSTSNKVTLMSKENFFRSDVVDIETRVDRGKDIQIAPLAFDTKWLEMSSDPVNGAYESYYKDTYGQVYGIQRIGTGYDFNTESSKLMESVVFRSGAQVCETSRYFNDVEAGGVDVLSQQLDAGNVLVYRNAAGDTKDYDVPVVSSPTITYWGSESFEDVDGYDWLNGTKLQCHDAAGKPLDGSGVLLFRTGVQWYDRFKISDDLTEMMNLNDGTPCWRMDDGAGVAVPVFSRYKSQPIYKTGPVVDGLPTLQYNGEEVLVSLDFGRVREIGIPYTTFAPTTETVTLYEKMWQAYLRDRYNINTRVVTAWVNMTGIQVNGEALRKFYFFDNAVWSLNRIINYSVTTDDPVQCEFVKVQDVAAYTHGQDFGGQKARGVLDITVSPSNARVTVDGNIISLTGGQATVSLTAGRHVVVASRPGYATTTQVVTIVADQTTVVSITLQSGVEQLYISVEPEGINPVIALSIDGVPESYTPGMNVADGSSVTITVSASGYATQTRTFTMDPLNSFQAFTMVASISASITPKTANITQPAQSISYTVSDPSNHGWVLDFDGPDSYGRITAAGISSGSAVVDGVVIRGTGNAVVYLTVPANTNSYTRTIDNSPFYFKDNVTNTTTYLAIVQLGTQDSQTMVTSVTVNKASLSLPAGASEQLTATVLPANATNKNLTWTSSNTSIVQVGQDGTVYAVAVGNASVTASSTDGSNKNSTCYVTVTSSSVAVTGVTLSDSTATVSVGGTFTLTPNVMPPNATNKSVTWSSSDPSVASVAGGVVTGVAVGQANITVTTQDGGYTASCWVTVTAAGSMSAGTCYVKGSATTASNKLSAPNMNLSTITGTCSAAWVRSVTIDKDGGEYYVRMTLYENTSVSPDRTATVYVNGYDIGGKAVSTYFYVVQAIKSPNDQPCTSMAVNGDSYILNSGNSAEYTATYEPSGCTQTSCTWSLVSGDSYATITPNGNSCVVTAKTGANGNLVTIRATNTYNNAKYAEKTIEVTYITPSDITVNPASVTVHAINTSDDTVAVSAVNIQPGTLAVQSVSGFITSASIQNGKLVAVFPQNTTSSSREGSVTVSATDTDNNIITAVVRYVQVGTSTGSNNFAVTALNVQQVGGKVVAKFRVAFLNTLSTPYTFEGLYYTLRGLDTGSGQTFIKSNSLANKQVASYSNETETYTVQWNGTLGQTVSYSLTITDQAGRTDTYTGDGNDII